MIVLLLTLGLMAVVGLAVVETAEPRPAADFTFDPCGFIDTFIKVNEKGKRWELSAYQRKVIGLTIRFDQTGELLMRILLWSEPKKSGKTLLAAALAWWWAATNPSTEIIIAANDMEQSQSRVFATMTALAKHNGFERAKLCRILSTEIRLTNETTIKAIASDFAGAAGARHSLVIFDELWGYSSERLQRLFEELTPPPSERNAWMLITTYAGFTGESVLLERLYQRGLTGARADADLEVYWHDDLAMFWSNTPRQPWQTRRYYTEQKALLRPSTYLRLHENRWVTGRESFITGELWDACVEATYRPQLRPSGAIYIGVDVGIKSDHCGVVAVSWREDTRLQVVSHRVWRPTATEPIDLEGTVEAHLRELNERCSVMRILCDPYQLHRSISTLKAAGLPIEEFPQTTGNCTQMGQTLFDLIKGRNLVVYPDADLRQAALNAVAVESPRGWRLAKEKASAKIDVLVAMAMACVAATADGAASCEYCDVPGCIGLHVIGAGTQTRTQRQQQEADVQQIQDERDRLWVVVEPWARALEDGDDDAIARTGAAIDAHLEEVERSDAAAGQRVRDLIERVRVAMEAQLNAEPL